jgi:hypothetical protein
VLISRSVFFLASTHKAHVLFLLLARRFTRARIRGSSVAHGMHYMPRTRRDLIVPCVRRRISHEQKRQVRFLFSAAIIKIPAFKVLFFFCARCPFFTSVYLKCARCGARGNRGQVLLDARTCHSPPGGETRPLADFHANSMSYYRG